jgi:HTH-type transcriptional regulator/antitoxin HigA
VNKLPTGFAELVQMYPPHAVRDDVDYENMREVIESLVMRPKLTKGQSEYLNTLAILFEAYEREHYAIDTSDITPAALLRSLMDEHGLKQSDLAGMLGGPSRVSEILSGKRLPSKSQAVALGKRFAIKPSAFLAME